MLTEFGAVAGDSADALETLDHLLDNADEHAQSWAYWQFKSYNDITTASSGAFAC
jgi:endoglycosylceramidase